MKITHEYLMSKGYREYKPISIDHCDKRYQKRFDDEVGKKYYIDIEMYDFSKYGKTNNPIQYQPEINLNQENGIGSIRITFWNDDIDEIEKWCENYWQSGDWDYYEKWSED